MKKVITNVSFALILGAVIFITSCNETDPLPISKADFKIASVAPEVDIPVQFENLSLNASYYAWDFGDGTKDSLTIDPEHTYTEPGAYLVKMTAYTEDGQKSESIYDIDIGERYLTGMYLININMNDENDDPWDDDGSGPDVFNELFPEVDPTEDEYIWVFYDSLNVGQQNNTPLGITVDDYKLLNKNYIIRVLEINTENEEEDPRFMAGELFNPVVPEDEYITVTKRDDGTGDIVIPFADLFQFQFYLEFEIR